MTKRFINAVALTLMVLLFTQCEKKSNGQFTIEVTYRNLDKMASAFDGVTAPPKNATPGNVPRILLEEIPFGGDLNPVILDSATLTTTKTGKVILKGTAKEEGIYQVVVENGPLLLVINDEPSMRVDIDLAKRDNYYTVSGSKASSELKEFIHQYSERTYVVNKAFSNIDSLKQLAASDSMVIVATESKNRSVQQLNDYLKTFIDNSSHPALSLFALGWSSRSLQQPEFDKLMTEVVTRFPEHEVLRKLKTTYEMQQAQAQDQQKKKDENSWVGKTAPELGLPTADGNVVSLSSFRGKYLLVDFWASWCGPCRQENPNVVKVFNQYKDRNFGILGVSLDKEKEPWLKAIKEDQLTWTHVSDLKYWNSKAVDIYRFEGIPFNVLIDPKGKIIAENLRGFDLEKKLGEVLQ